MWLTFGDIKGEHKEQQRQLMTKQLVQSIVKVEF
jgi:hypothetical protein